MEDYRIKLCIRGFRSGSEPDGTRVFVEDFCANIGKYVSVTIIYFDQVSETSNWADPEDTKSSDRDSASTRVTTRQIKGARVKELTILASKREAMATSALEYVKKNEIDIVIPMNCPVLSSIIPTLPPSSKGIAIANGIMSQSYKYIESIQDFLHAIVVCSPRQKQDLVFKYGVEESKIALIPHSIDIPNTYVGSTAEKRFSVKGHSAEKRDTRRDLNIIFIGRLDKLKGTRLLPALIRKLNMHGNFQFEILGDGPDMRYLKERLNSLANVKFSEPIARQSVLRVLESKDILIMPSLVEGFGLVQIEAMSRGVVVISNKIEGVTDFILKDGVDGFLVRANRPSGFAKLIYGLDRERSVLSEISSRAVKSVGERFTIELQTKRYLQLFRNAAKEVENSGAHIKVKIPKQKGQMVGGGSSEFIDLVDLQLSFRERLRDRLLVSRSFSLHFLDYFAWKARTKFNYFSVGKRKGL